MAESEDGTRVESTSVATEDTESMDRSAAEAFLESLHDHGVDYMFANLGTDHSPILEGTARIRRRGGSMPEMAVAPHEFVALSAAHGYAAVTGDPQAVLVHVDVGTQNLGCGMHNAMRANAPVFIMAGLAPVSETALGGRAIGTHYKQDVFDQPGIVDDYCKWTEEYRAPADPDAIVTRGLTRAKSAPAGPVYLSAAREAWESEVPPTDRTRSVDPVQPSGPDPDRVEELADIIGDAESPVVITSKVGAAPRASEGVESLVAFAETAGAAVVEHIPATLSFPRNHDLHAGFAPSQVFDHADLVILAGIDIPWVPAKGSPRDDAGVIQIDVDPTKATMPYWDFRVDVAVDADPVRTLTQLTEHLDTADGESGRETWTAVNRSRRASLSERLEDHRDEGRMTASVVSDVLNDVVDRNTIVLEDAVTNSGALKNYVELTEPGSFHSKYGAGLGWGVPAGVGAKMAAPESRVISVVGDGAYMFGHPSSTAWLASAQDAPTLTVAFNNSGWNAVKSATTRQHPSGDSATDDVPESKFDPPFDLTVPATMVDAYTAAARDEDELADALQEAVTALDRGEPAVIDAKIEPI